MIKILRSEKRLLENSRAKAKVPLEAGGNQGTPPGKICSEGEDGSRFATEIIVMNNSGQSAIIGLALWEIAATAQAASHVSTRAEREQTRVLNEQQLGLARHRNAGLPINAGSLAKDAAATAPDNSPPAAAPTMAVQRADNPPLGAAPAPAP